MRKRSCLHQDLGEMNGLKPAALARKKALQVHQATRITRYDVIGSSFQCGGAFHLTHSRGNHGELRCERPAKAAANFGLSHLDQLESLNLAQELPGRLLDSQLAQTMAAIVESYLCRKARAQVRYA